MNQESKDTRYQFGFKSIFALTAVVAVCCTVLSWFDDVFLLWTLLVVYMAFVVGWAVMRGPYVYNGYLATRHRRLESRERLKDAIEQHHAVSLKKQAAEISNVCE
ncbi:MAG: hypothetical protein AAF456_24650 [Planctomycetota bacterium]